MISTDNEQWRAVVGFEGLYEVSDRGRVRSLDRIDSLGRQRLGKVLGGSVDGEGYIVVGLTPASVNGVPARCRFDRAHVLVLTAFVGPRPVGMEGCHGDGNPANNALGNLRWDTQVANRADALRHGTALTMKRRRSGARVRRPGMCLRDHRLIEPNLTAPSAARTNRRCLACQRGHNTVKGAARNGEHLDIKVESDRHYGVIVSEVRQAIHQKVIS